MLLALCVHLLLFVALALYFRPSPMVRIALSLPAPEASVQLSPREALRAVVYFDALPGDATIYPKQAKLYAINDAQERTLISTATLHPEEREAIRFSALTQPGNYLIVLPARELLSAPYIIDGEWSGEFPTGDGVAGGDFEVPFQILAPKDNVLSAYYREHTRQEPPPFPAPTPQRPELLKKEVSKPKPPKPVKSLPTQPPQAQQPAQESLQPSRQEILQQKYHKALQFKPDQISQALYEQIQGAAQSAFEAQDQNAHVAHAQDLGQKVQNAYLSSPSVSAANQGFGVQNEKSVSEYIALMHKEIHPRWAHTYLLELDLNPSRHDPRAQGDLSAITEIVLDSLGKVINVTMVRTSGVAEFDNEAILVSWQSSPGLALPPEMRSNNGKAYVHWTFWRDTRQCGTFGVKAFKLEGDRKNAVKLQMHAIQKEEERLGIGDTATGGKTNTPKPPSARINPMDD